MYSNIKWQSSVVQKGYYFCTNLILEMRFKGPVALAPLASLFRNTESQVHQPTDSETAF